jgi:hypothetical protein
MNKHPLLLERKCLFCSSKDSIKAISDVIETRLILIIYKSAPFGQCPSTFEMLPRPLATAHSQQPNGNTETLKLMKLKLYRLNFFPSLIGIFALDHTSMAVTSKRNMFTSTFNTNGCFFFGRLINLFENNFSDLGS